MNGSRSHPDLPDCPALAAGSVISRGTAHVESDLHDQTVMLSLDQGAYFAVAGTAQRIWSLIRDPIRFDSLIARLTAEYAVDPGQCAQDVAPFLQMLAAKGLARIDAA